ncbi:hypothetical protein NQ023_04755 [Corynebacterium phoceense]|uniref:TetR/AcrR family transcriptional regulator n=1 Tax=Corynebacterium phoceense TaxID=1686286 RepID=UPI00211CF25A|nr:hypothetical protein [Corynebacterium phoceense]MCQ9347781.1 hypothetical protein [Corynebacterium phoceense]
MPPSSTATTAGVDPGLVRHYFGTKETKVKLLMALGTERLTQDDALFVELQKIVGSPAERLVRRYFFMWEHPPRGPLFWHSHAPSRPLRRCSLPPQPHCRTGLKSSKAVS